jgi:hypothetical protein
MEFRNYFSSYQENKRRRKRTVYNKTLKAETVDV